MKNDLRVVKTKENIVNNFIHLLSLYDFKDITIQMLISECKINKTTFYRHYIDKYDLI
ncbi:TetR/AcrR family transcriptional regulator [uncultured Catenibacterium sp.]|nr:TetR/AcrR family transcriptional regulator [uncultured Catenibacterium sp.]